MNIKKLFCGLAGAAVLLGAQVFAQDATTAPGTTPALETETSFIPYLSATVEYASRYMSKGEIVNPERVVFNDFYAELFGFYVELWTATDLTDYNEGDRIDYEPEELDYIFGYNYTFEDIPIINSLKVDLNFTYFDYPSRSGWDKACTEQEIALKLVTDIPYIAPGFMTAVDYEDDIWWAEFFISNNYTFDNITEDLALNNKLEMFWGNSRFNGGLHDVGQDTYKSAITTIVWSVDLTYNLNKYVSFGPFGQIAWAINHDIREDYKASSSNNACNMLWGLRLSAEF